MIPIERVVIGEGAEASAASISVGSTVRSTESLFPPAYQELTVREMKVLRLLATGLSNKQIARRLILSPHTVNRHVHSIFGKLAFNSRSAATRYALEHHIA